MKTVKLGFIALAASAFFSCGTHPKENMDGDTTLTNYDQKRSLDTSKPSEKTGNSGVVDNSGNGGTKITVDSTKVQKSQPGKK
jgi:hypothetical protein